MKPKTLTAFLFGATLFAATPNVMALPPRQHSVSGVVEAIDCASHTITLRVKEGAAPLSLVWNDGTRFTRKGGCAKSGFDNGQTVRVSYRREYGQNMLREVSAKAASTLGDTPTK
jgi:hypothetical protein